MRKRLLSTVASPVARDLIARVSHIPACTSANSGTAFAFYLSRGLTTSAPQPLGQSLRSGAAGKATELARTSVLLCEGPKVRHLMSCKCKMQDNSLQGKQQQRCHNLCLQGLTTFAARWQDSAVSPTGLNPLMQTPGPAIQLPTPALDSAVPQTAQAVLRKTKISPKKLNEFAKLVRRLHIEDALVQCQVAPNKAAKLCYKVQLPLL